MTGKKGDIIGKSKTTRKKKKRKRTMRKKKDLADENENLFQSNLIDHSERR